MQLERLDQLGQKETKEILEPLVVLECKGQEDILVPQEVLVHKDLLEQKAQRELLVLTVLMELKETKVILDQLDRKDRLVHEDLQDPLDQRPDFLENNRLSFQTVKVLKL